MCCIECERAEELYTGFKSGGYMNACVSVSDSRLRGSLYGLCGVLHGTAMALGIWAFWVQSQEHRYITALLSITAIVLVLVRGLIIAFQCLFRILVYACHLQNQLTRPSQLANPLFHPLTTKSDLTITPMPRLVPAYIRYPHDHPWSASPEQHPPSAQRGCSPMHSPSDLRLRPLRRSR